MSGKKLKISGIVCSVMALFSLALPVYSTYITKGEACNMIVRGYNLAEFSPWGCIVLILPVVLIGLGLSKLKPSIKTIGLLILFLLSTVALHSATTAAYRRISEIADDFVKMYMNPYIYGLLMFSAMVFLWVSCNTSLKKFKLKNFFKKEISANPVYYSEEKFYWCNKPYDFIKYKENGETVMDESTLCFVNSEGYFAALNISDSEKYFDIEVLEADGAVASVIGTMPSGIFGIFYEDQDFLAKPDTQLKIRSLNDIKCKNAKLRISDKNGSISTIDAIISLCTSDNIRLSLIDMPGNTDIIGAAVMQDDELIAFVSEYDAENCEYKCISAEIMAVDLCRKIYEDRVYKEMKRQALSESTN